MNKLTDVKQYLLLFPVNEPLLGTILATMIYSMAYIRGQRIDTYHGRLGTM